VGRTGRNGGAIHERPEPIKRFVVDPTEKVKTCQGERRGVRKLKKTKKEHSHEKSDEKRGVNGVDRNCHWGKKTVSAQIHEKA